MGEKSKRRARRRTGGSSREDWRHILSVAGPIGAVVGTLLIGAVLRAGPAEPPRQPATAAGAAVATTVVAPGSDLDVRAGRDALRLGATGDEWTLQFMVACDETNVRPLVDALGNDETFFVLHAPDQGPDCFRLCWGRYLSREDAVRPRRYPQELRAVQPAPLPKQISGVLP